MLIIADSSPLISLAILNQLTLLENLFSEIIIPQSVFVEITETGKPLLGELVSKRNRISPELIDKALELSNEL